jgi:uncharacterized phage protein (TIGR01671 family)
MREIKFRGKREDNGEWVYGGFSVSCDKKYAWVDDLSVTPSTIGQYTGLKDKNGTEIYEGDIFTIEGIYPKLVKYLDGCAAFGVANISDLASENFIDIWQRPSEGWWNERRGVVKIIGNIHDSPEPLETNSPPLKAAQQPERARREQ